jgi:uncharacterized hydrophobic protein (TIGR00341 family)
MKYLEIIIHEHSIDIVKKIAQNTKAKDLRHYPIDTDHMQLSRMIVSDDCLEEAIDGFSHVIGAQPMAKIIILPIEAYLPKQSELQDKKEEKATVAREAIYNEMMQNTHINTNFVSLLVLSTIVAAIGLIQNDLAIIIGAMVIAPLLGPNIAFSFATSIGDSKLMYSSLKTVLFGVFISIALPMVIAFFLDNSFNNDELLSRTHVDFDSFVLALASGAAASLSITTGLSSVLVGVMVSVALLPPAVVFGIMLGSGNNELAIGSGILLLINIISINLASKAVFFIKNIRPRLWHEKEEAKKATIIYTTSWIVILVSLSIYLYFHPNLSN